MNFTIRDWIRLGLFILACNYLPMLAVCILMVVLEAALIFVGMIIKFSADVLSEPVGPSKTPYQSLKAPKSLS